MILTIILIGAVVALIVWLLSKCFAVIRKVLRIVLVCFGWGIVATGCVFLYDVFVGKDTSKIEDAVVAIVETIDNVSEKIVERVDTIDVDEAKRNVIATADRIADKIDETLYGVGSTEAIETEFDDIDGLPYERGVAVETEWYVSSPKEYEGAYRSRKVDGQMMVFKKDGGSWVKCKYTKEGFWVVDKGR